jgi:hypothetical protein
MATYIVRNKQWFKNEIERLRSKGMDSQADARLKLAEEREEYAKIDPHRSCTLCKKPFGGYQIELLDKESWCRSLEWGLQKNSWIWLDNKAYCPDCVLEYFKIGLKSYT